MNEYTIKTFLIFHRYSLKRLPYLKSFTSEFCSINKQPLLDWTSERTSSGQLKEFLWESGKLLTLLDFETSFSYNYLSNDTEKQINIGKGQ